MDEQIFQRNMKAIGDAIEIIRKLKEAKIPELIIGISNGELIVLKKEEAVCPVCGYEFQSKFSERKT